MGATQSGVCHAQFTELIRQNIPSEDVLRNNNTQACEEAKKRLSATLAEKFPDANKPCYTEALDWADRIRNYPCQPTDRQTTGFVSDITGQNVSADPLVREVFEYVDDLLALRRDANIHTVNACMMVDNVKVYAADVIRAMVPRLKPQTVIPVVRLYEEGKGFPRVEENIRDELKAYVAECQQLRGGWAPFGMHTYMCHVMRASRGHS